jgi:hypothetical protein
LRCRHALPEIGSTRSGVNRAQMPPIRVKIGGAMVWPKPCCPRSPKRGKYDSRDDARCTGTSKNVVSGSIACAIGLESPDLGRKIPKSNRYHSPI